MTKQLQKLSKGKITQLKHSDILDAVNNFPNMSHENYSKLDKAYKKGCGCRVKLCEEEMVGSGFLKKLNKVGKAVGKVAVKSGIAGVVIDEAVGALPLPQSAQNMASRVIKKELKDYAGAGIMKRIGKVSKGVGRAVMKSGAGDILIDEALNNTGLKGSKYQKMVGDIAKAGARDVVGAGIMKKIGKVSKGVGKAVMKSGAGDILIDEALNNTGLKGSKYQKMVGDIAKAGARDMVGGGNPYLPSRMSGAGFQNYGIPLRTYSDLSNMVRPDTDAFHPSVYNLPMYSTPIAQQVIRGKGFRTYV